MWDITKDELYQKAIKLEYAQRWARQSNRERDALDIMSGRSNGLYNLEELLKACFDKGKGLPEIRKIITQPGSETETGIRIKNAVEAYINQILLRWDDRPERYLDAVNRNERPYTFDASIFADKPYEFLNALLACFPESVLQSPGLMAGEWKEKAFLPDNLARTAIGLGAAYQAIFVHKTRSYLNYREDMDSFAKQFKQAFGENPFKLSMRMPLMNADQSKQVLRYFKKSVMPTDTRESSIMSRIIYLNSDTSWIMHVFGRAGVYANPEVCERIIKYKGDDTISGVLSCYIAYDFAPLNKLGRLFKARHVTQSIVDRLIDPENDNPAANLTKFLKGFAEEDKAWILKKMNLPADLLEDRDLRRRALANAIEL
ncbi:hypothetical protein P5704_028385 (plasmid) [Pseudomonas sp. FeN3W]|nr:hypothetical protein P5704_028385 [Pseudomonas sp. FeN3W]